MTLLRRLFWKRVPRVTPSLRGEASLLPSYCLDFAFGGARDDEDGAGFSMTIPRRCVHSCPCPLATFLKTAALCPSSRYLPMLLHICQNHCSRIMDSYPYFVNTKTFPSAMDARRGRRTGNARRFPPAGEWSHDVNEGRRTGMSGVTTPGCRE
jgi:hypothetical protein